MSFTWLDSPILANKCVLLHSKWWTTAKIGIRIYAILPSPCFDLIWTMREGASCWCPQKPPLPPNRVNVGQIMIHVFYGLTTLKKVGWLFFTKFLIVHVDDSHLWSLIWRFPQICHICVVRVITLESCDPLFCIYFWYLSNMFQMCGLAFQSLISSMYNLYIKNNEFYVTVTK